MDPLEPFLSALRPLLRQHGARAAYLVGSWARGEADAWSDVDVVIVAPSPRPAVERFEDYLPAILASPRPVELFVYTPDEFQRMRAEERPFRPAKPSRRLGRSWRWRGGGSARAREGPDPVKAECDRM